jgi:hypothetical protein
VVVFRGLQADEQEAEQERGGEEDVQDGAVARTQRVVRDRDRDARGQQDGGVDRRQAERGDGLERAVAAADDAGAVGGPGRSRSSATAAAC